MKTWRSAAALLPLVCWLLLPVAARCQDNISIPKSRLEELERKEKELEKLKQTQAPVPAATNKIVPGPKPAEGIRLTGAETTPAPVKYQAPALASLPALQDGETVEAMDLASHYLQNPAAAEQRYNKRKIVVRGEIAGFEKPMFRRDYKVLLKTPDRDCRIVCDLLPAEQFSAVFTVNHGTELVGLQGETQVPLAKAGETVLIDGVCKGLSKGSISITASSLRRASLEH